MRSDDFDQTTWFSNSVKFANKRHYVRHVFDHMPANDLVKLIVRERIRKDSEIVNDVSMTARVRVDADCARKLVLTTTDVENSLLHLVFVQQE